MSRDTRLVHNPVLGLPAAQRIVAENAPWRGDLRALILELRDQAKAKGDESLRKNKYMMFAYWRVCGVYMTHIARALGAKAEPQDETCAFSHHDTGRGVCGDCGVFL